MYSVSCEVFFLPSFCKVRSVTTLSTKTELALQDTEGEAVFGTARDLHFATGLREGSCKVGGSVLLALCKTLIRQKNDVLQLKTCLKTFAVFS
jgi:hypothetical protein